MGIADILNNSSRRINKMCRTPKSKSDEDLFEMSIEELSHERTRSDHRLDQVRQDMEIENLQGAELDDALKEELSLLRRIDMIDAEMLDR